MLTPVGLMEGSSRARAIAGSAVAPPQAEVVVIGGGYVGTSAALTLAERGVSVALCEKGVIAGEASGRSMGYVDSQLLDPVKLELVGRSKALWGQMNQRTCIDTGYRPTGLIQSLADPAMRSAAEAWLTSIRDIPGIEARLLTSQELTELLPEMRGPPPAALYTPTDACVEPELAAPAIAEAAKRRGAHILQQCAVRGLETQAGRVSAVVTERGAIACGAVILAGGSWTPLFLKRLGVSLPQLSVYLSMMSVTGVLEGPKIPFSAGSYGFRPHADGDWSIGVVDFAAPIELTTLRNLPRLMPAIRAFWPMARIGFSPRQFWREFRTGSHWSLDRPSPFEQRRVQVPEFRAQPIERAFAELCEHFPVFRPARVKERWSGVINSTPDNMPVIGPLTGHLGVFVGTALTFGLTMGPAAGEALADLAMGRAPAIDLHPYRLDRFSDGSPISYRP
jgi:glycine/D-amino acid oxidase-like deaminating enzyme